jgi:DNA-binding LytR/AlgR family response regulator
MDGFEFGVMDYLLKPIRFERFLKTVNRVLEIKEPKNKPSPTTQPENQESQPKETSFFVKADGVNYKVLFQDIHYLESKGNFVQLHLQNNKLLTADTLSNMEEKLSPYGFLRVHKSYLVNQQKVSAVDGHQLIIGKEKIPVGNSYRQVVKRALDLE